jgi:hypothetical protein
MASDGKKQQAGSQAAPVECITGYINEMAKPENRCTAKSVGALFPAVFNSTTTNSSDAAKKRYYSRNGYVFFFFS